MSKIELSLLSKNNLFGQNKLSFIKLLYSYKYTYFAQMLGLKPSNIIISKTLYNDTSSYLLASYYDDKEFFTDIFSTDCAVRPIVKYSDIEKYISNEIINSEGLTEVEFGEFPQNNASSPIEQVLEEIYTNGNLTKLNQVFTTYRVANRYKFKIEEKISPVYEYKEKKYIRVEGNFNSYYSNYSGTISWIEISPIKWIVDKENDIAVIKNTILSGIPFNNTREYDNDFTKTFLYKYLNTIFIKEITTGLNIESIIDTEDNQVIDGQQKAITKKQPKIIKRRKEENVIRYYMLCNKLKTLIRSGWKVWNVAVDRLESVAEHIYGVQMLAIAMKSEYKYKINLEKVILMLAIHELGEIIIGDLIPFEITKEEKHKIECDAVQKVLGDLLDKEELYNLFLEFDNQSTDEAKFAFMCDKLECDLQCKIYDEDNCVDMTKQRSNNPIEDARVQELLHTGKSWSELWITSDQERYNFDKNFKAVSDYILTHKIKKI